MNNYPILYLRISHSLPRVFDIHRIVNPTHSTAHVVDPFRCLSASLSIQTLECDHSTWQPSKHHLPKIPWTLSTTNASLSSNTSAHSVPSASIPSPVLMAPSAPSSVSALCAFSLHSSLPFKVLTILQVLCAFRTKREYCDGHHDVAPICEQFLTDKGCKYRKEGDHPWLARSHDVELRRCMDVMLKPHRLGLYGMQHF